MKHFTLPLATLRVVAFALASQGAAQAADTALLPKGVDTVAAPTKTTTLPTKGAPPKPLNSTQAATGPGTQTEDDIYVGTKRQVQGVNTPGTTTPQVRPSAGTSPNTGASTGKKTARTGGDDDLDDLEVERRKVQGVNMPTTGAPQVRPGAGTSPNTGRVSSTGPVKPLP